MLISKLWGSMSLLRCQHSSLIKHKYKADSIEFKKH